MKKNKNYGQEFRIILIVISIIVVFLINVNQAFAANACCEKTINGAWCQNTQEENCDVNFKKSPTSCESTSYCKQGCCFDSQEGLCLENTPQRNCAASNGTWENDSECDVPQCNLGCCILGDQGAFVTLTRCKQMSGYYGLKTDFRRNIANELTCIAIAQGEDKGACVTDNPETLRKECKFTTRAACKVGNINNEVVISNVTNSSEKINFGTATADVGFYKDILCTADELGTICAPNTKTTLVEGKDEVYFLDTCGNIANIYDASRYNDKQYWKKVFKKQDSCGYGSSNAQSSTCGNCDYYLGSIGKKATEILGRPTYGNYICADLSCKKYDKKHGESWCETDSPTGDGKDTVGSRYFKEVCVNNEVITEPCADFRNEICMEDDTNGFTEAACRTNKWQDCLSQTNFDKCHNSDKRYCRWYIGYIYNDTTNQIEKLKNTTKLEDIEHNGICLPEYPPGFEFWKSSSTSSTSNSSGTGVVSTSSTISASSMCDYGSATITLKWVKKTKPAAFWHELWNDAEGEWDCNNTECEVYVTSAHSWANITLAEAKTWARDINEFCLRLGDCGTYVNWFGKETDEGMAAYLEGKRVLGSGGSKTLSTSSSTTSSSTSSSSSDSSSSTTSSSSSTADTLSAASSLVSTISSATGNFVRDLVKNITKGEE